MKNFTAANTVKKLLLQKIAALLATPEPEREELFNLDTGTLSLKLWSCHKLLTGIQKKLKRKTLLKPESVGYRAYSPFYADLDNARRLLKDNPVRMLKNLEHVAKMVVSESYTRYEATRMVKLWARLDHNAIKKEFGTSDLHEIGRELLNREGWNFGAAELAQLPLI